jgi:hypothetical protein
MERRRYSVLGLLVLGACVVAGCGNKKEDSPTGETASTATLTPEVTVPPVVPPPPPVTATTPPPPPKKEEPKGDPAADSRAITNCCNALRRLSAGLKSEDRSRLNTARSNCADQAAKVRRGEVQKDKAFISIKSSATGFKIPTECN